VFEPHNDPVPDSSDQLPPLDVPLRGRKGEQVSAYIQELAARLDHQRARAELAEQAASHLNREVDALRNQPPPSFDHLGTEAAKVLEEAGRSAKVLVDQAVQRGRELVQKAEATAAKVRADADADARARLEAARQAAEQMLAKANGERSAAEAETRRLHQYRDDLLGHLNRVQSDLAGFLVGAGDAAPAPPPPPIPPRAPDRQAAIPSGRPAGAEPGSAEARPELPPPPAARPEPAAAGAEPDAAAERDRPPGGGSKPGESAIAAARAPR
jgi:hypothetical protein